MEPNFSANMSDRERLQLLTRNAQPKQVAEPILIETPTEPKIASNNEATMEDSAAMQTIDSESQAMLLEEKRLLAQRKEAFDDSQHRRRRDEYEQEDEQQEHDESRDVELHAQPSQEASLVEGMDEEGANGEEKENNESDLEEFKDLALTKKSTAKGNNSNDREDGNKKRGRAGQDNFKSNNNAVSTNNSSAGGANARENVAVVNLIDPTNTIPQRHWICSKCKSCREYIRDNANRGTCLACGCGLIFHLKGEEEYEQGTLEDLSDDDGEFGEYDSDEERERRSYKDDEDDSY